MSQQSYSRDYQSYIPDPRLSAAIEVALDLGMPLLVTGEPGTGKTQLAHYLADQVVKAPLLEYYTKTTSKAKDILYQYNALQHFRNAQSGASDNSAMAHIQFQALGKAILEAPQQRYVVLIDEIDKAPRDFPNDVLFEFDNFAFRVEDASVNELQAWATAQKSSVAVDDQGFIRVNMKDVARPVLIMTSNSEKNLPDAFLRRCVYFHIPFPDADQLKAIINAKTGFHRELSNNMLSDAIDHFLEIREKGLRKKPATAELLAWLHVLQRNNVDLSNGLKRNSAEEIRRAIFNTYFVLAKNKEDLRRLGEDLGIYL